jgi:hypothetical protein
MKYDVFMAGVGRGYGSISVLSMDASAIEPTLSLKKYETQSQQHVLLNTGTVFLNLLSSPGIDS